MSRPVALVTGSTSGIGQAVARRLAADGLRVMLHSRTSAEAGHRLADELDGGYLGADLADPDACARLVADTLSRFGRLDVLVNNAGISRSIPHDDLAAVTPQVWRELLDVNLVAPWLLITAALPALRAGSINGSDGSPGDGSPDSSSPGSGSPGSGSSGGAVVNVTSWAGVRPAGASVPYAATKAALNHVTRLLAAALAPGVRVNAVAPGLVDTPMTADWADARQRWAEQAPMRRAARPADVADLVSTLVHHRYLTGEVVVLDGGMNLR